MYFEHILGHIGWLLSDAVNKSYSFRQRPNRVNLDSAQYVQSSSGMITIVVMTLCLFFLKKKLFVYLVSFSHSSLVTS